MTRSSTSPATAGTGTRFGYFVAALINAALLYAINVWPRWGAVPFLTDHTPQVLGLVNASIVVGLIANVVYVVAHPTRVKALGDLVTTAVALAALLRIWRVFPFDFGDSTVDWPLIVRIVVGIGIAGSVIGLIVAVVRLVRGERSSAR